MSGAGGLSEAAPELRYLLGRGYPLEASLSLVGNRHDLRLQERDLLRRGVVAPKTAEARRAKLLQPSDIRGLPLAVDGHNQLITLESALKGGPLVAADDGLVRDVARAARTYRPSQASAEALALLLEAVSSAQPASVLFLLDAPISHSGELAAEVRGRLAEAGLVGEARAEPYPEKTLTAHQGPVATADGPLVDCCERVIDLAGGIVRERFAHLLISLR